MDLTNIKTKTGKTIKDFMIPKTLLEKDSALVELIMGSESMQDSERQYWFNLTQSMNPEQIEKLRDILTREKQKLAEIEAKYAPKPKLSPEEAAARNAEMEQKRAAQQASLKEKEAQAQAKEVDAEEALLNELENL